MGKRVVGESETVNWVAIGFAFVDGDGDGDDDDDDDDIATSLTFSGKLSLALLPLNLKAASS